MKTGSDLTELQDFRNHTSCKQSCLNSDCLLFGRKAINAYVANSVLSALHWGCTERGRAAPAFSVQSVRMVWLWTGLGGNRLQELALARKMHSASHCLAQGRVGFWFDLNIGDEFRAGAFLSLVFTFLQMWFHSHSLL